MDYRESFIKHWEEDSGDHNPSRTIDLRPGKASMTVWCCDKCVVMDYSAFMRKGDEVRQFFFTKFNPVPKNSN